MIKKEDHLIFKEIQNGDRKALNYLFELYFEPLCHFVNAYVREPMLAEEIVSDVFFNLWVKRKTLKITGSLKPYLFKAARNQSVSYMRRPSFQHQSLEQDTRLDQAQQPDALLIHQENLRSWQKLIDRLPERCRMIFLLHREEDFTYKEIAGLLNITEKTVENQMGKALRSLREWSVKINHRFL